MRVRVLGPLQVDGAHDPLPRRDRLVLSVLTLRVDEHVDAQVIADALWRGDPPPTWPKVVQGCVSRLRRLLGVDAIETTPGGYRLRAANVSVDRQDFEELIERAREHADGRAPERARMLLGQALDLWRGQPFDALSEWMPGRLEAMRLTDLRLAAQEDLLQARLDAGEHREVAAEGTVLVGEQPYRESRWRLLALAQYRSGRQADALASIRTARRALGRDLGLDPGSDLVALESAILAQDPALTVEHEARVADAACPWKGLASYAAEDSDGFFGRQSDVDAGLAKLSASPMLVLAGASGSGKSSLVNAGLVPALRRLGMQVESVSVGHDGRLDIAAARARSLRDPVLVVDQLEDALAGEESKAEPTWATELACYARDRGWVVVAVRSDRLSALGADVALARLAERGLHLVTPLSGPALRQAVEGPARLAGLRLEAGLVDLVLRDAENQPGAMPLLSHALAETWRRREGNVMTVDGYHLSGGISDAVAASAERLFDSLSVAERDELRWVMLRLVSSSDSGQHFRTPLPGEVVSGSERRRVLDLLVRSRLVTAQEGGYELAHQALIGAWPRLRTWLDEDTSGQRLRRHLSLAAGGWEALGRPESELYRGARLEAVLEWQDRGNEPLSVSESEFVAASRAAADDRVHDLEEQARRQRRQNRRLRLVAACAAALLLVAVVAARSAVSRGHEADRQRDTAAAAAVVARHEALVERSLALRSSNRTVGALLAVEAWRRSPDLLSQSALMGALTFAAGFMGSRELALGANASAVALPGSGRVLATADGGALAFVDPATGRSTSPTFERVLAAGGGGAADARLVVSADGTRAAELVWTPSGPACTARPGRPGDANQTCPLLLVYDTVTREPVLGPVPSMPGATDVALSADGGLVAVAGGADGELLVWDVDSETRVGRLRGAPGGPDGQDGPRGAVVGTGSAVTFLAGNRLLVGSARSRVREISARTLEVIRTLRVPRRSANRAIATTRRGDVLVTGDRVAALLDPTTGRTVWRADIGADGDDPCHRSAVAEASDRFFCGGSSGLVVERDLVTGLRTGSVFAAELGTVNAIVLTEHDSELVVFSRHWGTAARWRLDGVGLGSRVVAPGMVATGGYDPAGRLMLAAPAHHVLSGRVLAENGRTVLRLPLAGEASWLSATTVAVLGRDPGLVDTASGDVRRVPVLGPDTVSVHAEPSGSHAWSVIRTETGSRVVRFAVATGRPTGPAFDVKEAVPVHVDSDGETVLVTFEGLRTEQYDVASGQLVARGLYGAERTTLGRNGTVITVDGKGTVEERALHLDAPIASFPGSRGPATSLQLSSDRRRLMVTATDRSVYVYDTATQVTLVGAMQGLGAVERPAGWLRPDGEAFVVSAPAGIVEWDLDPELLVDAACHLAGRNLTLREWEQLFGDERYVRDCRQFPSGGED